MNRIDLFSICQKIYGLLQQLEIMPESEQMYKVETILDKREGKKKGKLEYLVKWEGWDIKQSTWEPETHLKTVMHLIEEFQKKGEKNSTKKKMFNYDLCEAKKTAANILQEKDLPFRKKKKIEKEKKRKTENSRKPEESENSDDENEKLIQADEEDKRTKKTEVSEDSIESGKAQMKIHGMRKQEEQMWFYISEGVNFTWVLREYVIQKYPVHLCEFYQSRMIIE